ncbi:MAG: hypothetical protein GX234_03665 [Clostridiales bacterium]|nr:hypothetical protein [Clostridiales bacterium]
MHIAICDDNVADRKQMERLLGRESDTRKNTTGILYIDSFGDSASLLNAPMLYDLFFLDLHEDNYHGMDFAKELRTAGVTAPIVLCSSKTDYEQIPDQPEAVHHMRKPIRVADLSAMIDLAITERASVAHRVEIRCEQTTYYVEPSKIVYAEPKGHLTGIHFENGDVVDMLGNLNELYYLLESTKSFIFAKKKMLVNLHYIEAVSLFQMKLTTGENYPLSPVDYHFIKKYWPLKE